MANMKIENYEGTPDAFTFPFNPTVFDDASNFFMQVTNFPFNDKHIVITTGSLNPKNISLQGYFSGSSKEDNYRDLLKKTSSPALKKFYFDDNRFYIVMSSQFKKTHSGGRTNFLDYVGSLTTPIPFVFSSTQKSASYNGSVWTDGTGTNAGKHKTFIEKIVVTLSGGSSGDTLTFKDNNIGGLTVTLPSYINGDTLTIYLIKMVESNGYYTTEYWYSLKDTTPTQRGTASGRSNMDLVLSPSERIDTYTVSGTANYSNIVFYWRDSNLS